MITQQSPDLYWSGGPFRVSLHHSANAPEDRVNRAVEILEGFRSDCQSQYCAFSGMVNGRGLAYERFKSIMESRNNKFSLGTAFPGSEQQPGKSTIVQISHGELLDGLEPDGTFEDQNAKAFILMIYHRWDEKYRHLISRALSVPKKSIQCDLMGDVRHVRNAIIHNNSDISQNTIAKLQLLRRIWNIPLGALKVSQDMLHSLMEQINAIHVRVS